MIGNIGNGEAVNSNKVAALLFLSLELLFHYVVDSLSLVSVPLDDAGSRFLIVRLLVLSGALA